MRITRRRIAVGIGLLSLAVLVVVFTKIMADLLYIQLRARDEIRSFESQVEYCQFTLNSDVEQTVRGEDQLFFMGKSGDFYSPRFPEQGCGFVSLAQYPAATSNVYIVVDNACPRDKSERDINWLPYLHCTSNVSVFIVGALKGDPSVKVCEPWAGAWSAMQFAGRKLDCSVVDSLFYVSHWDEYPLLGWLAFKCGIKKDNCVWEVIDFGWDGITFRRSYTNALHKTSHTID